MGEVLERVWGQAGALFWKLAWSLKFTMLSLVCCLSFDYKTCCLGKILADERVMSGGVVEPACDGFLVSTRLGDNFLTLLGVGGCKCTAIEDLGWGLEADFFYPRSDYGTDYVICLAALNC